MGKWDVEVDYVSLHVCTQFFVFRVKPVGFAVESLHSSVFTEYLNSSNYL